MGTYRFVYEPMLSDRHPVKRIEARRFYSVAEARELLDRRVTEATIKTYCRAGAANGVKVTAKPMGPKRQWHLDGASILRLRTAWGLDS